MKVAAVATAHALLIGIVVLELWYISGERFGVFCWLLVLVAQAVFFASLLLGDYQFMVLVRYRIFDWLFALAFPTVLALGVIACLVLIYQVTATPSIPCGEVCLP